MLDLIGAVKDVAEVLWAQVPRHVRDQLMARAKDFSPFSVIPTNHDLLRGARIAWVNASLDVIDEVVTEARRTLKTQRNDPEAKQLISFGKLLANNARALRARDIDRRTSPLKTPIDGHVTLILQLAGKRIAGLEEDGDDVPVTAAFVPTLAELTGLEPGDVPEAIAITASRGVKTHPEADPRSFGALLLDELAEIIKGNEYPEVKEAYHIKLGVEMLGELRRMGEAIAETPQRTVDMFEAKVAPQLVEAVAARTQVSIDQAKTEIKAVIEQIVAEATLGAAADPRIVQERFDAFVRSMAESEGYRRESEGIDRTIDELRALAAKGESDRATEAFNFARDRLVVDHRKARDHASLDARKLLRFGIDHAIANGQHNVAAELIIEEARATGGATPAGQFDALYDAFKTWWIMRAQPPTRLQTIVLWRLAGELERTGADPGRIFRGAALHGRQLSTLDLEPDHLKWRGEDVLRESRRIRGLAVRQVIKAAEETPAAKRLRPVLAALGEYARKCELGVNPSPSEVMLEIWELRSALHACKVRIGEPRTGGPFRRLFDHVALRLVANGTRIDPLPSEIVALIAGDGIGRTPYVGLFEGGFGMGGPDALRKEARGQVLNGPKSVADGMAKLELALGFAGGQPADEVADAHLALAEACERRFWWEGITEFAPKAEAHFRKAADFYDATGKHEVIARIVRGRGDDLSEIVTIMSTPPAPPPPLPEKKKGLFGF